MSKRVLVIASFNGARHHPFPPGNELLEAQLWSLKTFKHSLDKVVVVTTSRPDPPSPYGVALSRFETVLYRDNIHGSYGSWNHAWDTYGDEFDWYFLIEDDYVFVLDNWDQKLIDLWSDGLGYLCGLLVSDHASMSGGLVSSAALKVADFTLFNRCPDDVYDSCSQIQWSRAFINSPLRVEQIPPRYEMPYYMGGGTFMHYEKGKPIMMMPVQMIPDMIH